MFDQDDVRGRCDDDAFRGDGAVADIGGVLVKHRHCRHELPQQAQRSVDVERDVFALGKRQNLRKADAVGRVRDQRQRGPGILQSFDAPHVPIAGVAERRQAADAFAQCELKRGHRRELAAQAQHFDRFMRAIRDQVAFAKAILEGHRGRRRRGDESWVHAAASCLNYAVRGLRN